MGTVGYQLKKVMESLNNYSVLVLFILGLLIFSPSSLYSQSDEAQLNLLVDVPVRINVNISSSIVSFTRSGPVTEPQLIPSNEGVFKVTIKVTGKKKMTVNVWLTASSDFSDQSTGFTIPVETISWKAEGNNFYDGQLKKQVPVLMAKISGSGIYTGGLYFNFADDPRHFAPGNYQTTVILLAEAI